MVCAGRSAARTLHLYVYGTQPRQLEIAFPLYSKSFNATAANVYLLMYPKEALSSALHSRPELADEIWSLLNRLEPGLLLEEGRVYGGGLHKLEPKELARVPASEIAEVLGLPGRNSLEQLSLLG